MYYMNSESGSSSGSGASISSIIVVVLFIIASILIGLYFGGVFTPKVAVSAVKEQTPEEKAAADAKVIADKALADKAIEDAKASAIKALADKAIEDAKALAIKASAIKALEDKAIEDAKALAIKVATDKAAALAALNKFVKSIEKSSPLNDNGNGSTAYLDRHDVNCVDDGINRFVLSEDGTGKMHYVYNCAVGNNGTLSNSLLKYTGWTENGNGNAIYLDRHDLQCDDNNVITDLQLEMNTDSKMRYRYKCAQATTPLSCRSISTPLNEDGGGNSANLDRHNVSCRDDEAISRVHLSRYGTNQYQYNYTCCRYKTTPVSFFTGDNFTGTQIDVDVGSFSTAQLGIPDDSLSSIKVPTGRTVQIFENGDFTGASQNFTSDAATVGSTWKGKVSSWIIT